MVYILVAEGFEEAEVIVPADLMRRAGVQVKLVGVTGMTVPGAHGISVNCDISLAQVDVQAMDMLVVPGGMGGVEHIGVSAAAMDLIAQSAKGDGYLAAICAAPSLLGKLGILKGRKAVCYPGMENTMIGALPQKGHSVVVDGHVVTAEGPGAAFAFGLKLAEIMMGADASAQVRSDVCWRH